MIEQTIGFIGAGNMAEAIIRGLLETKNCIPERIITYDINEIRLAHMAKTYNIRLAESCEVLVQSCTLLILAVKPQNIKSILSEMKDNIEPGTHTIISIAAGIPTSYIERQLGGILKVIRVMPNTPAQFLEGATAFCLGQHASEIDETNIRKIFNSIGFVAKVEESLMDAITALSGSGPAYVFKLCEMMIEAGKLMGIPIAEAEKLSIQTIFGAAKMLKESGQTASELRMAVTSKGGTTEAALMSLEKDRFDQLFINALIAAQKRSRELQPSKDEE